MFRRTPLTALFAALILVLFANSALAQSNNGNGNKYGVGKPAKIRDLPPGQLRNSLEALPPGQQKHALEWLQRADFPEQDVDSLFVNPDGDVYYADFDRAPSAAPGDAAAGPVFEAALPENELFSLHSKPGSANVLYLDFDGHTITGTAWNSGLAASLQAVRYSLSYNPDGGSPPPAATSFTEEERKRIHEIWHRIAEDYAAYDIDVTTEEPATFTSTTGRVLFTHDVDANGNPMPAQNAGGVAYLGVFGQTGTWDYDYYSPALVYYTNLYTNYPYHGDASLNAEAGSHEFGHNLDLTHDGDAANVYYGGHGAGRVRWGPIMGGSYSDNVTQFSLGEYPGANNSQDDLAVISGYLGYDADDVGDIPGSAFPISVEANGDVLVSNPEIDADNLLPDNKGVIGDRDDIDWWYLDAGAGPLTLTVTPAWHAFNSPDYRSYTYRGANLDAEVELYDAALNLLDSDDPTDDTYATVSTTAAGGRYYLRIDGVGNAVGTGYSDYGSTGMYFIEGTSTPAVADTTPPSPDPMTWATPPNATGPNSMNMVASAASDPSGVEYYFTCVAGTSGCTDSGWQTATTYNPTGLTADTYYSWRVRARDGFDNQTADSITAGDTTDPTPPAPPSGFDAVAVSTSRIDLSWNDNPDETGYLLERSPNGANSWITIATPAANETAHSDQGLAAGTTHYYRLSAANAQGPSGYATDSATTLDEPPDGAPSGLTATTVSSSQIDVSWSDNSGNEASFQVQRSADGDSWVVHDSVSANQTSYQDTGLNSHETWHYRVFARNSGGDSSPSNADSATTDHECSQTTSLQAGIWRLLALPCAPVSGQDTVADVFANLDPAQYGGGWVVYTVDNTSKDVLPLTPDSPMVPGAAYVVFTTGAAHVTVEGYNTGDTNIALPKTPQWNLNFVGFTGSGNRPWSEIVPVEGAQNKTWNWADDYHPGRGTYACDNDPLNNSKCRIRRVFHKWNGSTYVPYELTGPSAGTLEPFDVAIVWSYKDNVGMRIPQTLAGPPALEAPGTNGSGATTGKAKGKNKDQQWHVRLVAASGRHQDDGNLLGQLQDSQDGQDGHDLEELAPLAPPYLTITFENPAFAPVDWGLSTDFRSVTGRVEGEWRFAVRGLGLSEPVTLSWRGDPKLFENAVLVDEQTGEVLSATPNGQYSFTLHPGGVSYFRWLMNN